MKAAVDVWLVDSKACCCHCLLQLMACAANHANYKESGSTPSKWYARHAAHPAAAAHNASKYSSLQPRQTLHKKSTIAEMLH
jgi:hypothetical protein